MYAVMSYHLPLSPASDERRDGPEAGFSRSLHPHFSWITIKVVFRCVTLSLIRKAVKIDVRRWREGESGPGNFLSLFVVAMEEAHAESP